MALAGLAIREIPAPVPDLVVVQTGNNTQVSEAGTTDTFTVRLNTQPTSNVVVNVGSGDPTEATVNPATLTFTPSNWNIPQTVTVTGVDDALDDGDVVSNITLSIDDANSDNSYDPLPNFNVSVTTLDNDVAATTLVQLVARNLLVTDISTLANNLIVSRNGDNVRIHDPGNPLTAGAGTTQVNGNTVEVPLAAVTGAVLMSTGNGADTVTIDFGGGNPIPAGGLDYAGGAPTGAPGDKLILQNGTFVTSAYTFDNANDGSIVLDPDGFGGEAASSITYTGLDPISSTIAVDEVTLSYSAAAETITVRQVAADPTRTEVVSTAAESIDFVSPTVSLRIAGTVGTTRSTWTGLARPSRPASRSTTRTRRGPMSSI